MRVRLTVIDHILGVAVIIERGRHDLGCIHGAAAAQRNAKPLQAYIAADKVGYENTSQFSREFKRCFGQSPAEMMRELRMA